MDEIPDRVKELNVPEVKALFNEKAKTWGSKYQASGPLAFRVAAFRRLVSEHVVSANSRILDLGCGTGAIAAALAAAGLQVTACDVAEKMIASGKRAYGEYPIEWHLLDADWRQLPFERHTFDAIVASSVFEYLPDVSSVLMECHRVLRPGGILIATVPDPRTLTRKVERLIRPAAILLGKVPGVDRFRKAHSYAIYLKWSRNRTSLKEWEAAFAGANFTVVDQDEIRVAKAPLAYLICRSAEQK